MPAFYVASAGGFGSFARNPPNWLGERPYVALRIARPIGSIAVELVFRLLNDPSTRLSRAFAMLIEALLKLQVYDLRILSADRRRTGDIVRPFRIDDKVCIGKPHL